jgi:small-conductance mechanosensitive channel
VNRDGLQALDHALRFLPSTIASHYHQSLFTTMDTSQHVPSLFGNSWLTWLAALGVAVAVFLLLVVARRIVRRRFDKLRTTEKTELLEIPLQILSRTTVLFFAAMSLYCGSQVLALAPKIERLLTSAATIAFFWQAGVWGIAAGSVWLERKRRHSVAGNQAAVGSLAVISFVMNVAIWAMVVLLTLDNLGVDITALVAGLGIGGVAVALAVQNVLGDLFASLSITLDRPFVVGDFLSVGEFLGSVEYIGIKSTRLRSLEGEQIIIANGDLLGSRVRNYGRMSERRVVFNTSVVYETSAEQLEQIPKLIRGIVESQSDIRFDRSHFAKHAAASIDFETVYYVLTADYNRYMDIQQAINLKLHREFARLGIRFAVPTQRLLLEGTALERDALRQTNGQDDSHRLITAVS